MSNRGSGLYNNMDVTMEYFCSKVYIESDRIALLFNELLLLLLNAFKNYWNWMHEITNTIKKNTFNETLISLVYRRCTCWIWNDNTSCYYLKHLEDLEICLYNDFTSEKDQIYQFCSEHIYLLAFPYLMIILVVNTYYLY